MFAANILISLFNTAVVFFRIVVRFRDPSSSSYYAVDVYSHGQSIDNCLLFFGLTQEVMAILTSTYLWGMISNCKNMKQN